MDLPRPELEPVTTIFMGKNQSPLTGQDCCQPEGEMMQSLAALVTCVERSGFIVNTNGFIAVFYQLMDGKGCIIRFYDSITDFRRWYN